MQSFSSQLHEIIIDYLLIFAKVKPEECSGVILISDSKMQSVMRVCKMRAQQFSSCERTF